MNEPGLYSPNRFLRLRLPAWCVALCLLLSSCGLPIGNGTSHTGTITFGLTIPITGERAAEGAYSRDGYLYYVNAINRAGGIVVGGKRYRVTLHYYDDQSKAALVAKLYRKLIVDDKVNFLIGPYSSVLTAAAAPVAEQYRIPMVAPHGSARSIYVSGFKYVFGIVSPAENYLRGIIALVLAQHPRPSTIALLGEYEPFSREAITGAAEYAASRGMRVVDELYYFPQPTDVSTQLMTIKRAHPDVLLAAGHLQDAILIARQARDLCVSPKAMGFSVGPSLPAFPATLQSEADYIFGATQWTSDLRYRGDDQWATPRAYASAFRHASPATPTSRTSPLNPLRHWLRFSMPWNLQAVKPAVGPKGPRQTRYYDLLRPHKVRQYGHEYLQAHGGGAITTYGKDVYRLPIRRGDASRPLSDASVLQVAPSSHRLEW